MDFMNLFEKVSENRSSRTEQFKLQEFNQKHARILGYALDDRKLDKIPETGLAFKKLDSILLSMPKGGFVSAEAIKAYDKGEVNTLEGFDINNTEPIYLLANQTEFVFLTAVHFGGFVFESNKVFPETSNKPLIVSMTPGRTNMTVLTVKYSQNGKDKKVAKEQVLPSNFVWDRGLYFDGYPLCENETVITALSNLEQLKV